MRIAALIVCTLFISCLAHEQIKSKSTAWLPEQYIAAIVNKDTNAYKYLVPVEGFEQEDNTWYIHTYRGETNTFKKLAVIENGRKKYRIFNLAYYINLMENPQSLVDKLINAEVYFSRSGDRILLEIIVKGKREEVYYTNHIGDYKFKRLHGLKDSLAKKYDYKGRYY